MEQFAREFLQRRAEYNNLYEIVDSYSDRYRDIDVTALFHSKEAFIKGFPAICFTILRLREQNRRQADVLAILGFALHVHDMACKDTSTTMTTTPLEWYDMDLMIDTLQYILNCSNFNPIYYYKRRNSCIIF